MNTTRWNHARCLDDPLRVIRRLSLLIALGLAAWPGMSAMGQTSSLGARKRQEREQQPPLPTPRETPRIERNRVYERYAWTAVRPAAPKTFRVNDLITIIVREQRKFEADGDLETKKKFDARSELQAFFDFIDGGVGSATFKRGRPNIDYKLDTKLKSEGDTTREDRMTLRLTGKIIDVKPNGLLVLEARARIQHDEEISEISVTGTCRKEDVTADNSVLSTQIGDKSVTVMNEGAIRAASTRGWIPKLIDLLKPF